MTVYDLTFLRQKLALEMYDATKKRFPEIGEILRVWLNPEDKEQVLPDIDVPFYDDDRSLEFNEATAELSCQTHEQTGVLISLLPFYAKAVA